MDTWYHYLLLVVVGFAVGFINTVAGGASLISLPVLIWLGLLGAAYAVGQRMHLAIDLLRTTLTGRATVRCDTRLAEMRLSDGTFGKTTR